MSGHTRFFEELLRIKADRQLSRRQMEELVGVSSPGWGNWSHGTVPREDTCDQVAQRLGLARNLVRSWAGHPPVADSTATVEGPPPALVDDLAPLRSRLD